MAIESILEISNLGRGNFDFLKWVVGSEKLKVKLTAHCSCGRDYRINENFNVIYPSFSQSHFLRRTECPSCKDVSYIKHHVWRTGEIGFDYRVEGIMDDRNTSIAS